MTPTLATGVTTLAVGPDESGLRLDRWFRRHFPTLAHGRLERLLRTGQVRLDGKRAKAGDRIEPGQVVRIPPLAQDQGAGGAASGAAAPPRPIAPAEASELQARVLYLDDDVVALDKPAGLAVQGGTGLGDHHLDALLDALRFDSEERPRLVHRLDKDTSGVLVLARTANAAAKLTGAFRGRTCHKLYWAVTVGVPDPHAGTIDLALAKLAGPQGERMAAAGEDGLSARTLYQVIDHAGKRAALVQLMPLTGRTHQLRVHMAALNTPIMGDGKYGGAGAILPGMETARRLHLHARRLRMPHPRKGELDITAPMPDRLAETCRLLGLEPGTAADAFPEDQL